MVVENSAAKTWKEGHDKFDAADVRYVIFMTSNALMEASIKPESKDPLKFFFPKVF